MHPASYTLADGSQSLLGVTYQSWTWVFGLVGVVTVVIGTIFGARQLTSIARQSIFAGTVEFQRLTREHEGLVQKVLDTFPIVTNPSELDRLEPERIQEARLVVNSINDIGQLLEAGMIDRRLYFGLYHSQIIRVVYVLRPFMMWEEARIGGRYGRRLLRLDARAKRFHDMRAIHRTTTIRVARAEGSIDAYSSRKRRGLAVPFSRIGYAIRFQTARF